MNAVPDREQIRRAIEILHAPDAVIELRALHQKGRKRAITGYFDADHRADLEEMAINLNRQGASVYVVMNPLDPQMLARCANRVEEGIQAATDANVTGRHWLLIDIDPQRPKETSATPEQLSLVIDRAKSVHDFLKDRGWPKPVSADSGNGIHFLYRVDLPNDDASRDLLRQCLEALATRFDDAAVKVDKSVFNASRIVKLHGTVANKGDNLPTAPWRLSKLRNVPSPVETVSMELLQKLAAEAAPKQRKPNGLYNGQGWTETQVSDFLARGGLEATGPDSHNGAMRWKLKRCPFNPDHGPSESAVFLNTEGVLGFKCMHNSCIDRHWADLRELVDGPKEFGSGRKAEQSRPQGIPAYTEPETEVKIVTLANVEYQPLRPLWPNKLWRGKLSMMAGDPGLGKSLSTLDIAARVTRGDVWPASTDRAPLGDVVILSAEDDAADTLRPRLEACGADLNRVHVILEVIERDEKTGKARRKSFRLGTHLEHLERICVQYHPLLLIIDPITAYMSTDTDSHATADVRADLAPLADLAQRHGVAVLMVSHLNKATTMQALYRVTGSVAFVAAARSAFGVIRDPNDKERRYFLPLKSNLGKDTGGLAYRVAFDGRAPRIEWEPDPVDVDIDEVTATQPPRERAKRSAVNKVAEWLRGQLKDGPVAARDIWRRAKEAGHAKQKLYDAMEDLGVLKEPAGFAGAWHYSLPPETPQSSQPEGGSQNTGDSREDLGNTESSQSLPTSQPGKTAGSLGDIQSSRESPDVWEPGEVGKTGAEAAGQEAF